MFKLTMGTVLLPLLFSFQSYSQFFKNPEEHPAFKKYKNWGLYYAIVLYDRATITKAYGDYEMKNKPITSISFGFEKLIHPERRWTFKTGIHWAITPFYKFEYTFKEGDIYPEYGEINDYSKQVSRFVITIPLLVQLKKQLSENTYFNLEAGFHIAIMQPGNFSYGHIYHNKDNTEAKEVFAMYGDNPNTWIYPNIILSPGFYFTEDWGLVQANVIYQNSIPNYYKGEYQFGNLENSPPTRGDYKLSGDYIGLSVSFHFNKTAYRNLIR